MTPEHFLETPLKGALALLPTQMDTPAARAMIVAICLQESRLQFRRQVNGPARGYAQFERGGGVTGVLSHPMSAGNARTLCAALDVPSTSLAVYNALEHNDTLMAGFARLLLWTLPDALPEKTNPAEGWRQYLAAWRPGAPHPETWDSFYANAWSLVEEAAEDELALAEAVRVRDAAVLFVTALDGLKAEVAN